MIKKLDLLNIIYNKEEDNKIENKIFLKILY